MDPIPTAPMCISDNLPISAVSTELSKGTETLLIIFGIANRRISLFIVVKMMDKDGNYFFIKVLNPLLLWTLLKINLENDIHV